MRVYIGNTEGGGGGLLVTEKIKDSRGWNQITRTAQPREFFIFMPPYFLFFTMKRSWNHE